MYYQVQNNQLVAYSDKPFSGYTASCDIDYTDFCENPDKYIFQDNEIIENPDYENILTEQRKENFLNEFFYVENVGYYRKQPKGYSSAIESLNTAYNIVALTGKLPADVLQFYKKPDFTDEEQCSENWLVNHSFKNSEMTADEFAQFYTAFMTVWNNQEHL